MKMLKDWFKTITGKNKMGLRTILCFIGVIVMGFCLSWMKLISFGTDPCNSFNMGIANRLGIMFGNWSLIFNITLLILVVIFERYKIGIGTIFNGVLVGYSVDLFSYIWSKTLDMSIFESMRNRILILVPALIIFIIAVAIYISVDLGAAAYDALPMIISEKLPKVPALVVRMIWDGTFTIAGYFLGGTVGVITIAIALFLGPVITFVRKLIVKICKFE